MSGCPSHLRDLPMEIHTAFYPLPTIRVPDLNIPVLKKYEYKFDREREAILRYEQEQLARLAVAEKEQKAKEEEKMRREQEAEAAIRLSQFDEEKPNSSEDEAKPQSLPGLERIQRTTMAESASTQTTTITLLKPTPVQRQQVVHPLLTNGGCSSSFPLLGNVSGGEQRAQNGDLNAIPASTSWTSHPAQHQKSAPSSSIGNNKTAAAPNNTYSMFGLEEFETKRDLFGLVELRSLDDRRELEKLLLGTMASSTGTGDGK